MGQLKPENIASGSIVSLDTVTFIYFLEHHPRHYKTARILFHRIELGKLSGLMSSLVFAELLVPAFRAQENDRAETITRLLTNFPNLTICPVTTPIASEAARLRAAFGLRTPNAIHLATALLHKAHGLVTNDHGFTRSRDIELFFFDAKP